MDQDGQRLAQTTAHLLTAFRPLFCLNMLLWLVAWWAAWRHGGQWSLMALPVGIIGMAAVVLHIRLRFDAALFADFAAGRQMPPGLDEDLETLGLTDTLPARSMQQRCTGAMRLCRYLQVLTGIQWLLALLLTGLLR